MAQKKMAYIATPEWQTDFIYIFILRCFDVDFLLFLSVDIDNLAYYTVDVILY